MDSEDIDAHKMGSSPGIECCIPRNFWHWEEIAAQELMITCVEWEIRRREAFTLLVNLFLTKGIVRAYPLFLSYHLFDLSQLAWELRY